jgi:hypothetical protein
MQLPGGCLRRRHERARSFFTTPQSPENTAHYYLRFSNVHTLQLHGIAHVCNASAAASVTLCEAF